MVRRARQGDGDAMRRLVAANLRFVVTVARAYTGSGMSLLELISEGNMGLIEAVSRYDETRGLKFITYAVWWIRQAIFRALERTTKDVRPPVNQVYDLKRVERRAATLGQELGRDPTFEELVESTGLGAERVQNAMAASVREVSLDSPAHPDDEETLASAFAVGVDVEEEYERTALAETVERCLATLDPREQRILSYYFGFGGQEPMSLEKIGAVLGLTRERIRQLRDQALARVRAEHGDRLVEFSSN
ncbi:MAG: RNA polymerase sigma factor RpoD/SigA [Candidatus Latescibacterota bacterium]